MGGSDKRIRRGYDFTGYTQGLQCCYQRDGAVREQGDVLHTQIFTQCLFKLLVKRAGVGQPFALPDLFKIRDEFLQRWKHWLGNIDRLVDAHVMSLFVRNCSGQVMANLSSETLSRNTWVSLGVRVSQGSSFQDDNLPFKYLRLHPSARVCHEQQRQSLRLFLQCDNCFYLTPARELA